MYVANCRQKHFIYNLVHLSALSHFSLSLSLPLFVQRSMYSISFSMHSSWRYKKVNSKIVDNLEIKVWHIARTCQSSLRMYAQVHLYISAYHMKINVNGVANILKYQLNYLEYFQNIRALSELRAQSSNVSHYW